MLKFRSLLVEPLIMNIIFIHMYGKHTTSLPVCSLQRFKMCEIGKPDELSPWFFDKSIKVLVTALYENISVLFPLYIISLVLERRLTLSLLVPLVLHHSIVNLLLPDQGLSCGSPETSLGHM